METGHFIETTTDTTPDFYNEKKQLNKQTFLLCTILKYYIQTEDYKNLSEGSELTR